MGEASCQHSSLRSRRFCLWQSGAFRLRCSDVGARRQRRSTEESRYLAAAGKTGSAGNLAQATEKSTYIADEQIGRFHRREVAAAVEIRPVEDVVALLGIAADGHILGERGHAGG